VGGGGGWKWGVLMWGVWGESGKKRVGKKKFFFNLNGGGGGV